MKEKINICILDFTKSDIKHLQDKGFKIFNGTMGNRVQFTYSRDSTTNYCILNNEFPSNLHEYNVLIINMNDDKVVPYLDYEHQRDNVSTNQESKLTVSYPTTIFNPKPLAASLLQEDIKHFMINPSIILVFSDKEEEVIYQPIEITSSGHSKKLNNIYSSNYSFLSDIPLSKNKHGFKHNIIIDGELKKILEDFNDLEYHQTFYHPTIWDDEQGNIKDPYFLPLVLNNSNEIISYANSYTNTQLFVFPDIKNKGEFTSRFLTEIAPQILPDLFLYSNEMNWLDDSKYWVPGHNELIQKKEIEIKRHDNELLKIQNETKENLDKFKFLHNLITETDEKLVDSVLFILHYLGFKTAKKIDETKTDNLFEEDIQIEVDGKLLVIEVKGIGGTSKDSECSQISKIRLRRMKEKKSTEVYGLYIVNHERFKPPHSRTNPPFNEIQIQDAINDDRGLLTTWELYKLYFDITNGIITKEEVREIFFDYGLINFQKQFIKISKVDKTYKNGTIASFDINDIELKIGDIIISAKNDVLKQHTILSIEQEKKPLKSVNQGRIGISLDIPIDINSIILKRQ